MAMLNEDTSPLHMSKLNLWSPGALEFTDNRNMNNIDASLLQLPLLQTDLVTHAHAAQNSPHQGQSFGGEITGNYRNNKNNGHGKANFISNVQTNNTFKINKADSQKFDEMPMGGSPTSNGSTHSNNSGLHNDSKHPCLKQQGGCRLGDRCVLKDLPRQWCHKCLIGSNHNTCVGDKPDLHPCIRVWGNCRYGDECIFKDFPRIWCLYCLRREDHRQCSGIKPVIMPPLPSKVLEQCADHKLAKQQAKVIAGIGVMPNSAVPAVVASVFPNNNGTGQYQRKLNMNMNVPVNMNVNTLNTLDLNAQQTAQAQAATAAQVQAAQAQAQVQAQAAAAAAVAAAAMAGPFPAGISPALLAGGLPQNLLLMAGLNPLAFASTINNQSRNAVQYNPLFTVK